MGKVVFIGLGLSHERGISLEGLDEAKSADKVFAEFYTNTMPGLNLLKLEALIGRKVDILSRTELEEENARRIVKAATNGKVAFLVPGDPMIATTHVAIRLALAKKGVESRVVHGSSIVSAVCGATGLQSFKFGKSITLPHRESLVPASVLDTVRENMARGLHTLILLDVMPDNKGQLTVSESLKRFLATDPSSEGWLAVGAARIGASDELVRAARAARLKPTDFGPAPHSLVFPGKLHFMEAEALRVLAGAEEQDLEGYI